MTIFLIILSFIGITILIVRQGEHMSSTTSGIAQLQDFEARFQAFSATLLADVGSLTTAVQTAITLLNNSASRGDAEVVAAVAQLNSTLDTLKAQDTAVQGLASTLGTADAGATPPTTEPPPSA